MNHELTSPALIPLHGDYWHLKSFQAAQLTKTEILKVRAGLAMKTEMKPIRVIRENL